MENEFTKKSEQLRAFCEMYLAFHDKTSIKELNRVSGELLEIIDTINEEE